MTTSTPDNELEEQVKGTILRPLADKFQELARQIDSGEYKLPKTIKAAEAITERYIDQGWKRVEQLIREREAKLVREARISELSWALSRLNTYGKETNSDALNRAIDEFDDNIAELSQESNPTSEESHEDS